MVKIVGDNYQGKRIRWKNPCGTGIIDGGISFISIWVSTHYSCEDGPSLNIDDGAWIWAN